MEILAVIDSKHVENIEMAQQLHKIHADLTMAKEGKDVEQK